MARASPICPSDLAARQRHVRVLILESGNERLDCPGVPHLAEHPRSSSAHAPLLLVAQRVDQPLDVVLGLEFLNVE